MGPGLDAGIAALALVPALWLRPWRLVAGAPALRTPIAAVLVILPWVWALPALHRSPLHLHWSGAVLVLLMAGWPLAVLLFVPVAAVAWLVASLPASQALSLLAWQGIVPATLALLLGGLARRLLPNHPVVYILGRGFLLAWVCLFAARALQQWLSEPLPGIGQGLGLLAHALMAWGDALVTGMLCAIFVAYRPEWLLTWSDRLYLQRPDRG
jgi:uncharacterized membrane protein